MTERELDTEKKDVEEIGKITSHPYSEMLAERARKLAEKRAARKKEVITRRPIVGGSGEPSAATHPYVTSTVERRASVLDSPNVAAHYNLLRNHPSRS